MDVIINKLRKIDMMVYIYITIFSIAFIQRLGNSEVNYFVKYILSTIWIIISAIKLYKSNFDFKNIKSDLIFFTKLFLIPILSMILYSLVLFIIGKANYNYFGRYLSTSGTMGITILAVIATIYMFKEKALKYTFISASISFGIVIIYNVYNYGFGVFRKVVDTFLNNNEVINFFEVHDLTFAMGIIFINYLYFEKFESYKSKILTIMIPIIIMLMGFKRIQLIALIAIIIYMTIVKLLKGRFKVIFLKATGIMTSILCLAYVVVIKFGYLEHWMNSLGVNTMGRIHFYKWITSKITISPKFLGLGLGTTTKMMQVETTWPITDIHSDILKIYVEIGFIGFILWISYYLIYSFNKILKEYKLNSAIVYFVMTLYLFLLHFTDNTVNYFSTQYIYMIVCIVYTLKNKQHNIKSEIE